MLVRGWCWGRGGEAGGLFAVLLTMFSPGAGGGGGLLPEGSGIRIPVAAVMYLLLSTRSEWRLLEGPPGLSRSSPPAPPAPSHEEQEERGSVNMKCHLNVF